jgi:hypothetical protein
MFSYLLHNFSLESFLYYFIFNLTYDTIDHALFSGPNASYMTCDSLVSLVWVLTFRFRGGEILFTLLALLVSLAIWTLTTILKNRPKTVKAGEKEAGDKFSETFTNDPGKAAGEFPEPPFKAGNSKEVCPWDTPEEPVQSFFDMYVNNSPKAAEKFPELYKMARAYFDRVKKMEDEEMHRSREDDEAIKYGNAAFGGDRVPSYSEAKETNGERRRSIFSRENDEPVKYGNYAFGGGKEGKRNEEMHRNTWKRENDEPIKYGKSIFGGAKKIENNEETHRSARKKKNDEPFKYGKSIFGAGEEKEKNEETLDNARKKENDEAAKYAFGGGTQKHEEMHRSVFERKNDVVVKNERAPKSRVEEVLPYIDEEVGNWVP